LKKGVNPILGLANKERIDETMEMIGFELAEEDPKYLKESYQPKHVAFVG
jgi:diketogulonate reductase-like aldo/keto reductase